VRRADGERLRSFGLDWLRQLLHPRGQFDHRLETALSMLHRYDVIEDKQPPGCFQVLEDLPDELTDDERLQAKARRDQQKLYALVQYVRYAGDRKRFIHEYFGLPYDEDCERE
jgi:ATP-dependent DNA helicase RecQ